MEERGVCVLCGKEYDNYGNNPEPLAHEGRCCRECNEKVIDERVRRMKEMHTGGRTEEASDGPVIKLNVVAATKIGMAAYMALSESILRDSHLRGIFEASLSCANRMIKEVVRKSSMDPEVFTSDISQTATCVAVATLLTMMMSGDDCAAVEDMRALLDDSKVEGGDE